jgi:hypothetical protein
MAIVRVSGTVNSIPNGNTTISAPTGSYNVVAGSTATIIAGGQVNIQGAGTVTIGAVSTVSSIVSQVSTASDSGAVELYFAVTTGIKADAGYVATGTNIAVGSKVIAVTKNYSVTLDTPTEGAITTGSFIIFVPPESEFKTEIILTATNVTIPGFQGVTNIEGQLVVGPHVTTANNTTTIVNTVLINSTSTANVGNPNSDGLEGTFPPLAGVYDTSTNRVIGSVYVPGGLGVEKDLNVGGYIYGRVAAATSSTLLVITNTNTTTDFYPIFTQDIFGTAASQLYGTSSTFVNPNVGLTFNPGTGLLTTNAVYVASTANSTSTTTGAVIVAGGVAIGADLGVVGNIIPRGVTADQNSGVEYPASTLGTQDQRFFQAFADNMYTSLIQSIGTSSEAVKDITMIPQPGHAVDIHGDIRVRGTKPIGTAPVVTNVLWVTMDGDDTNDGRAEDPSRACRTITGATKSPYYQPGTQIRVRAGHYLEDNPIELKPYTSVMGSDLRTTSVEPINKTQDLFHVESGNYLAFMQFTNGRSGLLDGPYLSELNRGAYCTAFPPKTGADRIDLFHSPYIQNCTNQSGPWIKDGAMFQPDGTVQVPKVVGTATWVAGDTAIVVYTTGTQVQPAVGMYINSGQQNPGFFNARTLMLANKPFLQEQVVAFVDQAFTTGFQYDQVKCRRDGGLILTGARYDIALGTNYNGVTSGNAYLRGVSSVVTSTELVQTLGAITYLKNTAAAYAASDSVSLTRSNTSFDETLGIINSGSYYPLTFTNPIGQDVHNIYAKNLLINNKMFIQEEVNAWIQAQILGNIDPFIGFTYDQVKCYRDVGYIVDALTYDILYGGNYGSITAALAYYNGTQTLIPGERNQTVAAFQRLSDVVVQVVQGQTVAKTSGNPQNQVYSGLVGTSTQAVTVSGLVAIVTDAITAGSIDSISAPTFPDITWASTATQEIVSNISVNQSAIVDNMITYINTQYSGFAYNQDKCSRDTGLIVDALTQDLLFNTDSQSTFAGLQYWNQTDYTGKIASELTTTTAAINYVAKLARKVILADETGTRYQTAVEQNTALPIATIYEQATLDIEFYTITNILLTGTAGVTDIIVPNGIVASPDSNVQQAYDQLQANKDYIIAEAIAYVDNIATSGFSYDKTICARDVGYMIDSVSFDLLYGGNRQAIQSGVYYYGFSTTSSAIPGEKVETADAYNHLKNIVKNIVVGTTVTTYQSVVSQITNLTPGTTAQANTVADRVDTIISIIQNGPSVVTSKTPISLTMSTSPNVQYAATLLNANRDFIKAEIIAYINKKYGKYNQAKCYRDTGIIVDSLATDLLYQSTSESQFAGLQYWSQTEFTGAIGAETAAISYIKTLATNVATLAADPLVGDIVSADFDVIINILNNGTVGVTDEIISNGLPTTSTNLLAAYDALIAAIPDIQTQTIDYITNTLEFTNYNTATCYRDIGYIIQSVAFDLKNPDATAGYSNKQAIKSGVYYYGYGADTSVIANEVPQTTAAYNFIKGIIPNIVTGVAVTSPYQTVVSQVTNLTPATSHEVAVLKQEIDIITNIVRNGPGVAGAKVPMKQTTSTNVEILNAYNLLVANRAFIQAETISYVNNQLNFFNYSREKCFRDVGIIVENVAYDTVFGGNEKSVQSGLAYYNGVISRISGQETQTVSAIDYLNQLVRNVILNTTCTNVVETPLYRQVINTALIGTEVALPSIDSNFDTIGNIILNGPTAAPTMYIGQGPDAAYMSAEILMQANRQFIQQQTINYINWNLSGRAFPFSKNKCSRDISIIVDSVALDMLYPSNYPDQGDYSASTFAGLQYWNRTGYTGIIYDEINQTIDAVTYLKDLCVKIVQNITPADDLVPRYANTSQVTVSSLSTVNPQTPPITAGSEEVAIIKSEFDIIISILKGDTEGWTDKIVPNGTPFTPLLIGREVAIALLLANKEYLATEVNAYVQTINQGFVYDIVKCTRDVGYIIDAVNFDIATNGNRMAIQSGLSYYKVNGGGSAISTEIIETVDAFNYLNTLAGQVIQNNPVVALQNKVPQAFGNVAATTTQVDEITAAMNTITNIITNGPDVASSLVPIVLADELGSDELVAFELLQANKSFLVAETIAYIESKYNPDAFQYNEELCYRDTGLIVDAVSQDILLGGNSKSVECGVSYWNKGYNYVAGQETTTTMALNYARDVALQVVANQPVAVITGTTTKQVINTFFEYGGDYMPQQAISRNFNIITTIIEQGPLFAPPVYQGGGLFSATGQLADDVKMPAKVTYVQDAGIPGAYIIGLNTSTIGFGQNATLYFGDVSVYPLNDSQVEALAYEYTGNTSTWDSRKLDPIGSMGGSLVDGAVISEKSPINSFVYDAFTQVNQGGHGVKITNNGYAQLVSVFTVFCSIGVQVTNGGIASIVNSNANFGDICLLAKGYGSRAFSGTLANPSYRAYPNSPGPDGLNQYYPNGFWPNGGQVQAFIPDILNRPHISLVMEVEPNPGHINEQNLPGFLNAQPSLATLNTSTITITGIDTTGIAIGNSVYIRDQYGQYTGTNFVLYADTGTVVTDLGYQSVTLNKALTNGGGDPENANFFTLFFCGNAYYTVLSSTVAENPKVNGTNILSSINTSTDQVAAHISALHYLNTLTDAVISNAPLTGLYQNTITQTVLPLVSGGAGAIPFIDLRFNDTIRIIGEPTTSAEAEALYPAVLRTKTGTVPSGAGSAISLIKANLDFLAAEVSAFVTSTNTGFVYDEAICRRDSGYIIDGVKYDFALGTNYNAITCGNAYLRGASGNVISNEKTETIAAINYIATSTEAVVNNDVTALSRSIVSFGEIVDIINSGTTYAMTFTNPTGGNPNNVYAKDQLIANKIFLQTEVTAWIQDQIDGNIAPFSGFSYNTATCFRDVGYIVDALCYDILYGGNSASIVAAEAYFSNAVSQIPSETDQTVAAFAHLSSVAGEIIQEITVTPSSTNSVSQNTSGTPATLSEATTIDGLVMLITDAITAGNISGLPPKSYPNISWTTAGIQTAVNNLVTAKATIIDNTIDFINNTFPQGFTYSDYYCRRDVKLILQRLIYDIETGGRYNSVMSGLSYWARNGTHHIIQLGENVRRTDLFPDGATVNFYQRSYISASGYVFEYVGAGTNYGALPQVGYADPVQSKETVQLDSGKVFFTSTDQNGDFRIGPGLVISQATGVLSGRTFTKSLFANMTPFILAIEGGG